VEEAQRKQEAAAADTEVVLASRLGGKPRAAPRVEAALGAPASAAWVGKAEEPPELQGKRSPRVVRLGEHLAAALGAEKLQRDSYIRQAGEPGAEAALAARPPGGQRPRASGPPAWEGAGTTS